MKSVIQQKPNFKSNSIFDIFHNFFTKLKNIRDNKVFKYSFISIFIKTFIFILLISDDKAVGVKFSQVLFSVPPILVYISFMIIFLSISFLFKGKAHLWCLVVLNILLSIIYVGDIWYYRSNHVFLSFHMLKFTSNLDNLGESILAMGRPIDLLFIIDTIILTILVIKNCNKYKHFKRSISSFMILFIIPCLYLVYAHIKVDVYNKGYENQFLFKRSWAQNQTISSLTPIGYHIFDLYKYCKESRTYTLSENEKTEIDKWFKEKSEKLPENQYKGLFKGKNLIILQLESMENFIINQKVNGEEITPTLNKLATNGLYFENFYEQTHSGTTSDAELMTNTSLFPVREGSTFFRYPNNTYVNSLPNIMKGMGYNTLAVHPDKGSYWNWLESLKSIGFDKCIDSTYFKEDEIIGLGLSDGSFLRQLSDIIVKAPKPFYSFSITLTSHIPFSLPEKYKELNLSSELNESKIGKFFQIARYTDKQIGLFLDELDKKGILDNSVVVIYGDHEGVHRFFGDEISNMKEKEPWWLDNGGKVPFIIYSKGLEGKVISTTGGQIDILPTLSYLMGVDEKNYLLTSMGRNLLNTNKDFVILSNRKYKGAPISTQEQENLIKGIDLSDKIIQANYFKKGGVK